ncbi:hypothetical protein RFN25_27210 [Mesorhizobium abyssinicae]|uniref:hypothetical protein n=1 Tax=Mesorhizobium abyssinicae TaxID=1209958 RepID=UPI002A23F3D6|nr:hypothetical protein [Mesorhizobium abyssinicae]MDX8437121.1 hypothetical protein [Mesorhizobium abyssinicae]
MSMKSSRVKTPSPTIEKSLAGMSERLTRQAFRALLETVGRLTCADSDRGVTAAKFQVQQLDVLHRVTSWTLPKLQCSSD